MEQMTRDHIVQTIRDSLNMIDAEARNRDKALDDKEFLLECTLTAIKVLEATEQLFTPDDYPMPHQGIEDLELLLWEISCDHIDCTAYREDMRKVQRVNDALKSA